MSFSTRFLYTLRVKRMDLEDYLFGDLTDRVCPNRNQLYCQEAMYNTAKPGWVYVITPITRLYSVRCWNHVNVKNMQNAFSGRAAHKDAHVQVSPEINAPSNGLVLNYRIFHRVRGGQSRTKGRKRHPESLNTPGPFTYSITPSYCQFQALADMGICRISNMEK